MKRVLILQHIDNGGPGLFAEFLARRGVPFEVRRPDRGEPIPKAKALLEFAGIGLCGGTQSANDPLPWIADELDMIRAAANADLPVIGHCLGGQLISKALGGSVQRHSQGEFGWQRLHRVQNDIAGAWLDAAPAELVAMQWHEDAYSDPPGATPILIGEHCRNQAFVIGNMLGMQFHVELTEALIRHWTTELADLVPPPGPGIQHPDEALAQLPMHFPASRRLAESLYSRWLEG